MTIYVKDTVPSAYVILIILSLITGFACVTWVLRRKGVPVGIALQSVVLNAVTVIYFGVVFTLVTSLLVEKKPVLGLSSLGGVLGILLGVGIMQLIYKKEGYPFLKGYVLTLSLMYGVSKQACFFSGCCVGKEYHGVGALQYIGERSDLVAHAVFPVQLLESIVFLVIFALLWKNYERVTTEGMLCIYAVAKFLMDFLREAHQGGISVNQVVCLLIFVIGIVAVMRRRGRGKIWMTK